MSDPESSNEAEPRSVEDEENESLQVSQNAQGTSASIASCSVTSTVELGTAEAVSSAGTTEAACSSEAGIKKINLNNRNYRSNHFVDSSDESNGPTEADSTVLPLSGEINSTMASRMPVVLEDEEPVELPDSLSDLDGMSNRSEHGDADDHREADMDEVRYAASDSDSSDSSLHLIDDADPDSSSDSSDCILEDLEDLSGKVTYELS